MPRSIHSQKKSIKQVENCQCQFCTNCKPQGGATRLFKTAYKTLEVTTCSNYDHLQVKCLAPYSIQNTYKTNVKRLLSISHGLQTPRWNNAAPEFSQSTRNITKHCATLPESCPKKYNKSSKYAPQITQT